MNKKAIELQIDPIAEREPVIGPGMILERGRERVIVSHAISDHPNAALWVMFQHRPYFCDWTIPDECRHTRNLVWFAALFASGFRVIRSADTHPKADEREGKS